MHSEQPFYSFITTWVYGSTSVFGIDDAGVILLNVIGIF